MSSETAAPAKRAPCKRCGSEGIHEPVEEDCVLRHRFNKANHPPRATVGWICGWCLDRHKAWLGEILDLYATLDEVLLPGSVPDTTAEHGHVKKGAEAPPPVRLEVLAMTADRDRLRRTGAQSDLPDVPSVLTTLAERCCDERGLQGTSLNGTLTTAITLLLEHADIIAGSAWIDEYDAELEWVRTHLRQAHGISDGNPKPVGRCPSLNGDGALCGGPLWPDKHGSMSVECGDCKRVFDEPILRHLGGMLSA